MTRTPIADFARAYADAGHARLHMPGHKGVNSLGCEALDITEVGGADDLSDPRGCIAESEAIASARFGAPTYYSCEGSSLCIRAMLLLAVRACAPDARPVLIAARNAHRVLIQTAALLDFEIDWLTPDAGE